MKEASVGKWTMKDIDEVIQLLQKKRKSAKEVTPCNCIKGQCTCGNHKE